jgi:hypothetical protein
MYDKMRRYERKIYEHAKLVCEITKLFETLLLIWTDNLHDEGRLRLLLRIMLYD